METELSFSLILSQKCIFLILPHTCHILRIIYVVFKESISDLYLKNIIDRVANFLARNRSDFVNTQLVMNGNRTVIYPDSVTEMRSSDFTSHLSNTEYSIVLCTYFRS